MVKGWACSPLAWRVGVEVDMFEDLLGLSMLI